MTSGYSLGPEQVINDAVFSADSHKEIVVVKNIDIHSMCEHHMLPFTGVVHVGYIPNGKSEQILHISDLYISLHAFWYFDLIIHALFQYEKQYSHRIVQNCTYR